MAKRIAATTISGVGARVANFRKAAGLTQEQLGERIGISRRMVTYYEGQTQYLPAGLVPRIAKALNVSTDELLGVPQAVAEAAPRNSRLLRRLKQIEKLPPQDRRQVNQLIDTFIDRAKLREHNAG